MDGNKDMNIIKNIRTVEKIKSELLTSVAYLYEILLNKEDSSKEELSDVIANIVLLSLLMGKRIGLSYTDVINSLENNIRTNIIKGHKIEKWYGDLSELLDLLRLELK